MKDSGNQYVVGIISVTDSLSTVTEQEFAIAMPENVKVVMSSAPMKEVSYTSLMQFLDAIPSAADKIVDQNPDMLIVPSMTGSCIRGYEIVNVLEKYSGLPVIVPALEFKNALKELGKSNIAIISALGVELGLLEQLFFRNHDIQVVNIVSIFDNESGNRELIDTIDSKLILEGVKQADFTDVEAVIFDSPTYRLRPIIEELKKIIKVPMLSVNQILIRSTLKRLGLPTGDLPISRYFENEE